MGQVFCLVNLHSFQKVIHGEAQLVFNWCQYYQWQKWCYFWNGSYIKLFFHMFLKATYLLKIQDVFYFKQHFHYCNNLIYLPTPPEPEFLILFKHHIFYNPYSVFKSQHSCILIKVAYVKVYNMMFDIHVHSEMITTVKLINICSILVFN